MHSVLIKGDVLISGSTVIPTYAVCSHHTSVAIGEEDSMLVEHLITNKSSLEHIPCVLYLQCILQCIRDESCSSMHVPIDDHCLHIMLGCAHEQKAHSYIGVWLIGVANENILLTMLVGLIKRFEV